MRVHHSSPMRIGRLLLAVTAGTLLAASVSKLTPSAGAATSAPAPAPVPVSGCDGAVSRATPTVDDPNLLSYKFHCDGEVTAYTVLVNRRGHVNDQIDDFNPVPSLFDPSTGALVTTVSFNCTGTLPGAGVNCLAGSGGFAVAYATFKGQFDTSDPFCANLPKSAKPGTKPEPGAVAELVVTDTSGAEAGPFQLPIAPACKAVKAVPKPKLNKRAQRHRRAGRH